MARRLNRYIPNEVKNEELELCPCCDSEAVVCSQAKSTYSGISKYQALTFYWVYCPICKMRTQEKENKDDAIWAWNLRKYTEREIKRYAKDVKKAINVGRSYKFKRKGRPRKSGEEA